MRYFLVIDSFNIITSIQSFIPKDDDVIICSPDDEFCRTRSEDGRVILNLDSIESYGLNSRDRVVVNIFKEPNIESVIARLRSFSSDVPILLLSQFDMQDISNRDPSIDTFRISDMLKEGVQEKWRHLNIKRKVRNLRNAVDPAKELLILTQDDPDPDAIASGMALREVLGRDFESAPIVTMKKVSRNENVNMINLLGIAVKEVSEKTLLEADQIAMVDVQPSVFQLDFSSNLKIIVDHHPGAKDYSVPFQDIQVEFGATSSMFTEYLLAEGAELSTNLSTALYYGIKTDTLLFGREVSKYDFIAFSRLWHKANHTQISRMERPNLKQDDIGMYIKALKDYEIKNRSLFVPLGKVQKDNIVPRLADFVVQIGNTEFIVVWGIIGEEVTFSARSLSPRIHAGEVMQNSFQMIGSAGGHQSMARATVPMKKLRKELKAMTNRSMKEKIISRILNNIAEQKNSI
ncbi:MAG: DHHA1 domain-containing protein [Nitrospinota bacterium]|nr:DHHA1 domain-containing protein [Nitrospinota bacterium]